MTARPGPIPRRCAAKRTNPGPGFFNVFPAGDYVDQVIDTEHGAVVLQLRVLAIGGNC
jgi:hypothetical protein